MRPKNIIFRIAAIYIHFLLFYGCGIAHYTTSKIECGDAYGGAVWNLSKNGKGMGIVFSDNRLTFPLTFTNRFTPNVSEIELADRILQDNITTIIDTAKQQGVSKNLKSKCSLKKYLHQYIGFRKDGKKFICIIMTYKNSLSRTDDITQIISACDGGDNHVNVFINLDNLRIEEFSINGLG